MAVWSVLAAPLLMSVDLRTIRPEYRDIYLNPAVIAVNQDPLGIQGTQVSKVSVQITSVRSFNFLHHHYHYPLAYLC